VNEFVAYNGKKDVFATTSTADDYYDPFVIHDRGYYFRKADQIVYTQILPNAARQALVLHHDYTILSWVRL
jgi:hypothetical protein